MSNGVGIDLGTTHCCLYVYKHGRSPQVLKNKVGGTTTPSWVLYEKDGGHDVGYFAKQESPSNPQNTVHNAKRLIGRSFQDEAVQNERQRMPFSIINQNGAPMIQALQQDETGAVIWRKMISPEDVSATLLKYMKEIAEEFFGQPVSQAVITIPANFMETQRAATITAAKRAGFTDVSLLNEPTAAAIAYGGVVDEKCTILVFDFGGGTLDVTIMKVKGREDYKVLTTDGEMYLGGEDFDNEIVKYFLQDIREKHGIDLGLNSRALATLKLVAENAKIRMSYQHVNQFRHTVHGLNGDLKYEATLTREKFRDMFGPLLEKVLVPVKNALKAANLQPVDIDKVILVGGSTKLPAVKEVLDKFFRKGVVCADANPDEAIARGAAIQSYRLNNHMPTNITEVTAYHYGLRRYSGQKELILISELIPRGTVCPHTVTQMFFNAVDYNTGVSFDVFQSKRGFDLDKFQIGHFVITGLPARKQGECKFDVTFEIDGNNILHAAAQGQGDIAHYKQKIDIRLTNLA